ncbi:uncharacterized protein LOC100372962 precursor [Saccoglossus kowalevskii]|uniref:Uncharacterized protein LOC100372962 precursor n=1 Tax=Saccoglossus kowalevskii TaxID=10224 RepID=A0ABM0GH03_SACKO|nr:uncharacterized protein LOC100372962 precursor [Saccoglossus kowalevskii]
MARTAVLAFVFLSLIAIAFCVTEAPAAEPTVAPAAGTDAPAPAAGTDAPAAGTSAPEPEPSAKSAAPEPPATEAPEPDSNAGGRVTASLAFIASSMFMVIMA